MDAPPLHSAWVEFDAVAPLLQTVPPYSLDIAAFAAWEGTLLHLFDACGVTTGTLHVHW